VERMIAHYGDGTSRLPLHRAGRSVEEVFPIIGALWTGEPRRVNAVNVPNHGYVPNLPEGAIVEVPATVEGTDVVPSPMAPLPEPLAEFMNVQVGIQELVVRSALTGDPEPAFEALRRDPLSPSDESACRAIFDELTAVQAGALPF
jgi:alpha-galactosidase